MKLKKIKLSKLIIVIFLTVLIWVWADQSLNVTDSIYNATITIGNTRRNLWVSFSEGQNSIGQTIDIKQIAFDGSLSNFSKIKKMINNDPSVLEFSLVVEQFDIEEPGPHKIDVKDILRESDWIKKSGLLIESCDPCEVVVNTVPLILKPIDVQCYDEDQILRELEEPQQISMYVPADWNKAARVNLNSAEVQQATQQAIDRKPFITLAPGQIRTAENTVKIKLSPEEDPRQTFYVQRPSICFAFSENLLGKPYNVVIDNLSDVQTIRIFATTAAKEAYEAQTFQIELEITDEDIKKSLDGWATKEVIYKFPEEYVRKNEIELYDQKKETARFKVTLINPDEGS